MDVSNGKIPERRSYRTIPLVAEMPNLLEMQLKSYRDFLQEDVPPQKRKRKGLQAVFESVFPIPDVHNLYSLEFVGYSVGKTKYDIQECRERDMTYQAPLRATLRLVAREKEAKEPTVKDVIEQTVFLGEMPLITNKGTFVVNGADRVIVSQLHRSPGVFFDETVHPNGKRLFSARIIADRGSWVEFSMDVNDVMYVHIERKRKLPVTVLLRALGYATNEDLLRLFYENEELELGPALIGRINVETVVNESGGTANRVFSKSPLLTERDMKIYGKTGSTENPSMAWFECFAEEPSGRAVVIVVLVEGGLSGSGEAAPLGEKVLDLANRAGYIGKRPTEQQPVPQE